MGRGSRFLVSMAALACVSIQSSSDALALNEAAATSDSLALSPEWIAVTGGVIIVAIALAVVAIVRLSRDRKQALVSDVSAPGTDWVLFVREDFWLIVVTEGNEDEAEIHDAKRACREGSAGHPS